MKKFYKYLKIISKYIIFGLIMYVLNIASINGRIHPFTFGIYFALIWCNQNIFITSLIYVLSGFLATFTLFGLYIYLTVAVLMTIVYLVHLKIKKPIKVWGMCVVALLGQFTRIFLDISSGASIYLSFVELLFGMLFMLSALKLFECFIIRGVCRLTNVETIFYGVFIVGLVCGLSAVNIYEFSVIKLVGVFSILAITYITDVKFSLITSSSFAIGSFLFNNNPEYLAVFLCFGLTAVAFKSTNKYILGCSLLITEAILGFYFKIYYSFSYLTALPTAISVIVFLCIPSRLLKDWQNSYTAAIGRLTLQSVVNRNRETLNRRLTELAEVFSEMNRAFKNMISGGLGVDEAKKLLFLEIKEKICANCPEKNKCFRALNAETYTAMNQLMSVAFDRGRVTLLDLPPLFTSKCVKVNQLVAFINDLISQYRSYAGLLNDVDASKLLVAEELSGVSGLMKELSLEVGAKVNFDEGRERRIIDELSFYNIICCDALVYQDKSDVLSVTLAVRKEDSLKVKIPEVVGKICNHKMFVCEQTSSPRAGYDILNLKTAPKFQVVFGASAITKTGSTKSGDCFSIIKIKNDKYLFALCDGMGSGTKAEKASSTAINLVENFYKAGFENEIVLSCINKLLSIGREEIFSALDLSVIDARNGTIDFVKLGAPNSFIKHQDTTDIIETGALPLGILQTVEPKFTNMVIQNQDIVVLCTDGITDAFKTPDALCDYINNLKSINPQEIAETITKQAFELDGQLAQDDMTVLVARILKY